MSNFNMYFMQNRTTFMERLSERLTAIEAVLKKLEPVEGLLERVALLENTIYTTKKVFTFQEACMYIGVSESMLYKLTSNKEIPHSLYRGSIFMSPDTGKHFAHAVRPVQVFAQFHKVAARRCAKVIPFVEPVVDLERRSAFIAQR